MCRLTLSAEPAWDPPAQNLVALEKEMIPIASFALAGGAWIFAAFAVAWPLAIAYGHFTRRGSAINQRPYGNVYSNAPGAKGQSVLSHDQSAASRLTRESR